MTVDIDRLAELARAATPGPWRHLCHVFYHNIDTRGDEHIAKVDYCRNPRSAANAAYIAAADPKTILALIDSLRAAEADAERFRWLVENRVTHASFANGLEFIYLTRNIRAAIDDAMRGDGADANT